MVWLRGETALLRTCRQIHEEAMDLLYGASTFVVWITYSKIDFLYQWAIPSGLIPKIVRPLLEHFTADQFRRMRRLIVNVEHVDSYMGMIKYNCGGAGLVAGIRLQVQRFVDALNATPTLTSLRVSLTADLGIHTEIRRVKVHCVERDRNTAISQTVLDPFADLDRVANVEIAGEVESGYAEDLKRAMRT